MDHANRPNWSVKRVHEKNYAILPGLTILLIQNEPLSIVLMNRSNSGAIKSHFDASCDFHRQAPAPNFGIYHDSIRTVHTIFTRMVSM